MEAAVAISPHYREALQLYDDLKVELTKLVADRDDLLHTVRLNLEASYQLKIGKSQYELFIVRTEALRLKRKAEIMQAAFNRQEQCVPESVDALLDREFAEWHRQAREFYEHIKAAGGYARLTKLSVSEASELKRLYRDLAKKFHPDVSPQNDGEYIKHYWLRITEAYQNGDVKELRTLALLSGDLQVDDQAESCLDKLNNDCLHLRQRIREMINLIGGIKSRFPFNIADKLRDEAWVKKQIEEISLQISEWRNKKQLYAEHIEMLICQLNPSILN